MDPTKTRGIALKKSRYGWRDFFLPIYISFYDIPIDTYIIK